MATQQSLVKLSGKLGDMVFYQRGKKDVVRRNGKPYSLSAESKKSSTDFGRASSSAALIRKAFAPLVNTYGYRNMVNRLNARINALFKTIPATLKGEKCLLHANLSQLIGFEFNPHTSLDKLLLRFPQYQLGNDGMLQVILEPGQTGTWFKKHPKYQGVQLQLMLFNFDLQGDAYEVFRTADLLIDLSKPMFAGAKVSISTTQQGKKGLLVALGAAYFNESIARDRRYFACQINFATQLDNGKVYHPTVVLPMPPKQQEQAQPGITWEIGGF